MTSAVIRVEYVVMSGKTVVSRSAVEVDAESGTVAAVAGVSADGVGLEPAVTFTFTPALAAEVASGSLDLSVGFMRGAVKMAGDPGALLRALPALAKNPRLSLA